MELPIRLQKYSSTQQKTWGRRNLERFYLRVEFTTFCLQILPYSSITLCLFNTDGKQIVTVTIYSIRANGNFVDDVIGKLLQQTKSM